MGNHEKLLDDFMEAVRKDDIEKMKNKLRTFLKSYGSAALDGILKELMVEEIMGS